jgi:hypothetical protein
MQNGNRFGFVWCDINVEFILALAVPIKLT